MQGVTAGVMVMTKLDHLIADLCPDGVEYIKIENVCTKISSGGTAMAWINETTLGKLGLISQQTGSCCLESAFQALKSMPV